MRTKNLLIVSLLSFLFSCTEKPKPSILPQIIPEPTVIEVVASDFVLNDNTEIKASDDFKVSSDFLKAYVSNGSAIRLKDHSGFNTISFEKDEKILNSEAYKLNISENEIIISASTDQGAFYAVQSLRQLFPASFENGTFQENQVAIKGLSIEDEPQFNYRGMHLDVGRHMFSVDFIKKYIDALAMLKINTFHWHLTEDQGWRIEIKKYPKLQDIAAFRNETLIGHYSDQPHQFDGKKYGGYYTQEDIKEIVAYAQDRFVTIIPEIELPGHSQAAIAAYPELGCTGEKVEVATLWGVFEEVYCPKEETFKFLEDVLDEVIALFPSTYIHIGGDEAPKTHWKACEACQKRIKSEGLKDEHELQSYFISRIENYLNSKGRQIIGWDEILEGGLAPNATVMSWRGTKGAVEAAKQKHNVIITPTSHSYFNYYQSTNADEPLAIGGFLPLDKVYNFNVIPKELNKDEQKFVLGAQGNLWTEYIKTSEIAEYMAFPRVIAMSEVVWSKQENKNYEDFVSRLEWFHKRLDSLNINYANHLYEVEGELISNNKSIHYKLQTLTKDKVIHYTLDGSEPELDSEIYNESIPIPTSTTIKAAVFNTKEKLGKTFSETINLHKAVGQNITISKEPHRAYSGSGARGLINGISGSNTRFGDKEWLGFWGEDIEIVIDLGEESEINSVETRFYNGKGQWIFAPEKLEIVFDDNEPETVLISKSKDLLVDVIFEKSTQVRFIKIRIPNYGTIPDGLQGAGNKAWTFIDEIIVN
ncbi:beta-N-acetylhexosaminidase [Lacinutrix iliipiscaria]|uniref:beta-N-acetylhexosaminidase n=1 Tax=Lacinutrix iliipiscaria TaxID=1230532 RepID=A0ABW5WK65_9FLAO